MHRESDALCSFAARRILYCQQCLYHRFVKHDLAYLYALAKRSYSFLLDSIRAFFMSSKSCDMSFIWFLSCWRFSFSRRFYSIIFIVILKRIIINKVKFSARWQLLRACASAESATTCCNPRSRKPRTQ